MQRFSNKRLVVIFCLALGLCLAASGVAWACGCGCGGEGCTPGYWKQEHHFDSWPAPYGPGTLFSAVFEGGFGDLTLEEVLWARGGGLNALGRHAVAALLNAASPGVNYDLTVGEVIAAFNAVYPGSRSDYEALKNQFATYNEQGCPLD